MKTCTMSVLVTAIGPKKVQFYAIFTLPDSNPMATFYYTEIAQTQTQNPILIVTVLIFGTVIPARDRAM